MTENLPSRVRKLENIEQPEWIIVSANPNGVETAAETTIAYDSVNKHLYINTDGSTTWLLIV